MSLILSRRPQETICIGDNVRVTILEIRGNQARIAVEAPKTTAVDREEIRAKKQLERRV